MKLLEIHKLIEEVAPVHGIASDGRIDFREEATAGQRQAAMSIMEGRWLSLSEDERENNPFELAIDNVDLLSLLKRVASLEEKVSRNC